MTPTERAQHMAWAEWAIAVSGHNIEAAEARLYMHHSEPYPELFKDEALDECLRCLETL